MYVVRGVFFSILVSFLLLSCGWLDVFSTDSEKSTTFVFIPQNDRIQVGSRSFSMKDSAGSLLYEGSVTAMDNLFFQLRVEQTNRPQDVPVGTIFFVLPIEGTLMAMFPGPSAVPDATYKTFMNIRKPLADGGICPTTPVTYVGRMQPNINLTRQTFLYGQGR
ncbi:MAG: hypothetical protein N2442_13575, partial [Spirochaetes bacterium]|nr:hypothetical protein [Spirochaetota bacterium]